MTKKTAMMMTQNKALETTLMGATEALCDWLPCGSLAEALDTLNFIPHSFSMIVIDADLPKLDLKQAIHDIHTRSYVPEILVISEKEVRFEVYRDVLKCGIYDYIIPPFDQTRIRAEVKSLLAYSNTLQKLNVYLGETFMDSFSRRLALAHELAAMRRTEGKTLSEDELLAFFPLHERSEASLQHKLKPFSQALDSAHRPVILAVDDEEPIRTMMKDFLRTQRFIPLVAETAEQALAMALQHPEIDAFVLDIGLPGMNGVQLLKALKGLVPDAEALMLTGFQDHDFVTGSFRSMAADYVVKPFDKDKFLISLSRTLQRRALNKMVQHHDAHHIFDESLTVAARIKLLSNIAEKRIDADEPFLMEDVYAFFPELRKSHVSPSTKISKTKVADGLDYVVAGLREKIGSA
ncbi:MAG: response regulator [Candidatus Margulisiibacteriota bacterium]